MRIADIVTGHFQCSCVKVDNEIYPIQESPQERLLEVLIEILLRLIVYIMLSVLMSILPPGGQTDTKHET